MLAIDIEDLKPGRVQPLHQRPAGNASSSRSPDRGRPRISRAGKPRRCRSPASARWRARRTSSDRAGQPGRADELARRPSVSRTIGDRPGAAISSATLPWRIRKNSSAGSPSRNRYSPAWNRWLRAQPATSFDLFDGRSRRRKDAPAGYAQDSSRRHSSRRPGCGCGFALIAAASTVMSMPTGHQVMQRPQPTQPEVPN